MVCHTTFFAFRAAIALLLGPDRPFNHSLNYFSGTCYATKLFYLVPYFLACFEHHSWTKIELSGELWVALLKLVFVCSCSGLRSQIALQGCPSCRAATTRLPNTLLTRCRQVRAYNVVSIVWLFYEIGLIIDCLCHKNIPTVKMYLKIENLTYQTKPSQKSTPRKKS